MSSSKQKQTHPLVPPTTRSTASIAGKLAAMAAASNVKNQAAGETFESVSTDLLISELTKQRISIRDDISALIQESIGPLQSSMNALRESVEGFQSRLTATETLAGENFEKVSAAEKAIKTLQTQNASLLDRIGDLENRSRRANLRIVNVPEGSENGKDPVTFVAELLLEMTGTEVFDNPPILERAHQSPGQKPADGRKPRPFVVCFHRFQEKERLLRWARQHEMKYKGNLVRIYQDLSATLSRKRSSYNGIKQSLYQKGIRFQLLYPARLRVTFNEETLVFNTPEEAKQFYDQRINV
ncbi:LINE-1 type transposase domain-containing 1 [Labeo rohita]|uniref:LINE-1 type transposase domain-containing 1 n=1 Tax=Labeo rohita TaxID=84645 RepID=A0A498LS55_LABRO|nr:LINE-1 type transposase domain-containing 1 [Labeo rohita]